MPFARPSILIHMQACDSETAAHARLLQLALKLPSAPTTPGSGACITLTVGGCTFAAPCAFPKKGRRLHRVVHLSRHCTLLNVPSIPAVHSRSATMCNIS